MYGDYDEIHPPRYQSRDIDYILLTDREGVRIPGYRTIVTPMSCVKDQRRLKIYPYDALPGYDIYIYHDASYCIRRSLDQLLFKFKGGFGVKRHPKRDCLYEEGDVCVILGKASQEDVIKQVCEDYFEIHDIPRHFGLQETGLLIRDNSESTKRLCAAWRKELDKHTHRDQLGLPAAIFHTAVEPTYIDNHFFNAFFAQHPHKPRPKAPEKPFIAYIQPFASDMNIGKAYNDMIELMPENSWVVLTDHDVCYLHPKTKQQIEDVINGTGRDYDLLSCYTNRIGSPHQCYQGRRSENYDITDWIDIAASLHENHYGQVKRIRQGVAGFMMVFKKGLWQDIKFQENTKHFDTVFSQAVLKRNGKIGLMEGVLVWHTYRARAKDPQNSQEHLKAVK